MKSIGVCKCFGNWGPYEEGKQYCFSKNPLTCFVHKKSLEDGVSEELMPSGHFMTHKQFSSHFSIETEVQR